MRLAVLADIHGNYRALEAVLEDIEDCRVDQLLSLGDNVGYGPEPEEVVVALRKLNCQSIMGNHELALISEGYCNRLNPAPKKSLEISARLLSQDSMEWIRSLPAVHLEHGARFVHGCPPQSISTYLFDPSDNRLQRLFTTYREQFCFSGHTHTMELFSMHGAEIGRCELALETRVLLDRERYIILPGSIGQPRDMINNHAKYAIWDIEENTLEARAVPYDVKTTVRLLNERQFPDLNARRLVW